MSFAFTATVESDDLARIFTNALAFFPARGIVKTGLLRVWDTCLQSTGTDTYTVGRDECWLRDYQGTYSEPFTIELDRDGWTDIEEQARKDKGKAGRLEFVPGDALIFHPGGPKAEKGVAQDQTGKIKTELTHSVTLESREVWSLCDELLERMEDTQPIAFDPDLLSRFRRVKPSGDQDKIVDFCYQGEGQPLLAKVGPTFVGAVMPVDRAKYSAKQEDGQDALW